MKKILISQSNYIPWKGYFDSISLVDCFVIYDTMQFTKRDWRNRNYIKTNEGLKLLSIPVLVKGKFYQKINETQIANPNWYKEHWEIIAYHYKKRPFFKEISPLVKEWYFGATSIFLTEINVHFLKNISKFLDIKTEFVDSREFKYVEDRNQRLVDIVTTLGGNKYYSGPAAKSYIDLSIFNKSGIEVEFLTYDNYPNYDQQGTQFEHGVSIIDLIFNVGIDAKKYLKFVK